MRPGEDVTRPCACQQKQSDDGATRPARVSTVRGGAAVGGGRGRCGSAGRSVTPGGGGRLLGAASSR